MARIDVTPRIDDRNYWLALIVGVNATHGRRP